MQVDKKPLIGVSICAVVLLVLGSLSNVVGHQSVKSTPVNDSPFFSIRTNRATRNEDNRVITLDYLGRGLNVLSFPLRNNNTKDNQKSIDELRTMGQSKFNRFVSYVVNLIKHKDRLKDITIKDLINGLNYLRERKQNIIVDKESNDNRITYFYNFVPTLCWFPSCFICLTIAFTVAYALLIILFFSIITTPVLVMFPLH